MLPGKKLVLAVIAMTGIFAFGISAHQAEAQTIQYGSVKVSKSASSPFGLLQATSDQTVAEFEFLVQGEAVRMVSLTTFFVLGPGLDPSKITNVRLIDENGAVAAGPIDLVTDTLGAQYTVGEDGRATFTDTVLIPIGIHRYSILVDISPTEGGVTDTILVVIDDPDTDVWTVGATTNTTVTAFPISTPVQSNPLRIMERYIIWYYIPELDRWFLWIPLWVSPEIGTETPPVITYVIDLP